MFTINQVEQGIIKYLDIELSTQYPENSIQKVMIGTGIAILIKKKKDNVVSLLTSLGVVDEEGNVDVDLLKEEVLKQMPTQGIVYDNQFLGKITFNKKDIEKLYNFILEQEDK